MKDRQRMPLTSLVVGTLLIGFVVHACAEPPETQTLPSVLVADDPAVMMRGKLTRSKEILEALLRNDFRSISRAAKEMKRISEAAEWPRARDEVYERFSSEFRRQCSQLESLSQDLNREGVKFTYLNMTTTCINCHDYVRDSRRIAEVPREGDIRRVPQPTPRHSRFR